MLCKAKSAVKTLRRTGCALRKTGELPAVRASGRTKKILFLPAAQMNPPLLMLITVEIRSALTKAATTSGASALALGTTNAITPSPTRPPVTHRTHRQRSRSQRMEREELKERLDPSSLSLLRPSLPSSFKILTQEIPT